ncbi:MAG: hypothetical protein ACYC2U_05975 [Candidatus Amoebophilus sp.]
MLYLILKVLFRYSLFCLKGPLIQLHRSLIMIEKLTRVDIENLFNELGQTINTATKSSHHIINIHSGITLVNQDGQIMGMIANLSANAGGNLSLPD